MTDKYGSPEKGFTDQEGVEAIIALQAFAGIKETKESAENAWASFSDEEKARTMWAFDVFIGK